MFITIKKKVRKLKTQTSVLVFCQTMYFPKWEVHSLAKNLFLKSLHIHIRKREVFFFFLPRAPLVWMGVCRTYCALAICAPSSRSLVPSSLVLLGISCAMCPDDVLARTQEKITRTRTKPEHFFNILKNVKTNVKIKILVTRAFST